MGVVGFPVHGSNPGYAAGPNLKVWPSRHMLRTIYNWTKCAKWLQTKTPNWELKRISTFPSRVPNSFLWLPNGINKSKYEVEWGWWRKNGHSKPTADKPASATTLPLVLLDAAPYSPSVATQARHLNRQCASKAEDGGRGWGKPASMVSVRRQESKTEMHYIFRIFFDLLLRMIEFE